MGSPDRLGAQQRLDGAPLVHGAVALGDLILDFETLDLPGDPGQKLLVYSAEPGSPSDHALQLLASWASTPQDEPADQRNA
jgi:hypothetical protein